MGGRGWVGSGQSLKKPWRKQQYSPLLFYTPTNMAEEMLRENRGQTEFSELPEKVSPALSRGLVDMRVGFHHTAMAPSLLLQKPSVTSSTSSARGPCPCHACARQIPEKPNEDLNDEQQHIHFAKRGAAAQMKAIRPESAHCTLLYNRTRSYSAPGVPGTQQTPRPGAARLKRQASSLPHGAIPSRLRPVMAGPPNPIPSSVLPMQQPPSLPPPLAPMALDPAPSAG